MKRRKLAQWMEEGEKMYGTRIKPFWLKSGTYGYMNPDPEHEKKEESKSVHFGVHTFF